MLLAGANNFIFKITMSYIALGTIPDKEIFPGFIAKIIHTPGQNLTLVYVRVQAGTLLPEHAHPQEQVTNMLSGKLEITVAGEMQILEPGMVAAIPPDAVHSAKALTDCYILDVFHPMRSYN